MGASCIVMPDGGLEAHEIVPSALQYPAPSRLSELSESGIGERWKGECPGASTTSMAGIASGFALNSLAMPSRSYWIR